MTRSNTASIPETAPVQRTGRRSTAILLVLLSSGYIGATLNIQGFIGMMPLVQLEFGISAAQAGLYTSFYFASATIVAVFAGRSVDRLGTRLGLAFGVGTVGAMMVLHALSPAYGIILALAFVTGIGFSLLTPSVSKGILSNIDPARRAGAMGVAHGLGGSGALVGTALMPALGEIYGWRVVLSAAAIVGVGVAVLIALFFHRYGRRDAVPAIPNEDGSSSGGMLAEMRVLLSNRRLLIICIVGLAFGITISSATAHSALFLTRDLGYSPAFAGFALSVFFVGSILGQPSWGIFNDGVLGGDRRKGLLLLSCIIGLLCLVFGIVVSPGGALAPAAGVPDVVLYFLMFLLGFCVFGMPSLYFTAISEIAPSEYTGVATGLGLVFTRSGVVVAAPLFGLLFDYTGTYRLSWIALSAAVFLIAGVVAVLARRSPAGPST